MSRAIQGSPDVWIDVLDEPGQGGACHKYMVQPINQSNNQPSGAVNPFTIHFQNGPIKDFGVNGCQQEDLLVIVIDRLQSFQAGAFACRENAIALTKCQEALMWLEKRTADRKKRGVEGKNMK